MGLGVWGRGGGGGGWEMGLGVWGKGGWWWLEEGVGFKVGARGGEVWW